MKKWMYVAACLVLPLGAQEWTQMRGPNGTGISDAKTVPVAFSEQDFNWRVPVAGKGYSSPVCWGDHIFLTTCTDTEQGKRSLLCIRSKDGQLAWEKTFTFAPYGLHKFSSYASETPVVDAESIYLWWTENGQRVALALDHDGNLRWRRELGPVETQHGTGNSPVLYKDVLILPNDCWKAGAFIAGLDKKTGETRWRVERKNEKGAYISPLILEPADGPPQAIFVSTDHGMTALHPLTGAQVWEEPLGFSNRSVGSPVFCDGVVFVTAGSGGAGKESAAVRPGTIERGPETVYKLTKTLPYVPWIISKDGLMYLWTDAGLVTCVEGATGKTVWQERVGGSYFSSPVCVDGKLYAADNTGGMAVIATGRSFDKLAQNELGEGVYATPAIHQGAMYIRTYGHLISVGGKVPAGTE
jgi:outer membrane protein assembly factor BamB